MLDAEARMLLDLMEKAVQDGRPKLNTLPYAGRQAVDDVGGQRGRSAAGRRAADALRPGRQDPLPPLPAAGRGGPLPTLIYHARGFVSATSRPTTSTC